jgi:phospholipid-translocating P-type ATPase (flippase)
MKNSYSNRNKKHRSVSFEINMEFDEPLLTNNNNININGKDETGDDDCFAAIGQDNKIYCDNSISTTRYTALNFFPKSIFEQFRRLANVFFLLMSALMLLGLYTDLFQSSLNPYTTVGPLCLIVILTCLKEGLEDLKRRRSDTTLNQRKVTVVRNNDPTSSLNTFELVKGISWENIRVGDLVYVKDTDAIPADLLVIASSTENGNGGCTCFVETSNIDGETNLKLRESIEIRKMNIVEPSNGSGIVKEELVITRILKYFRGSIRFEKPNKSINTFVGTVTLHNNDVKENTSKNRNSWTTSTTGITAANTINMNNQNNKESNIMETIPAGPENLLLRGSTLRNTGWVWGLCVYTGKDSKIMQNSRAIPSKISRMDKLINKCIELIILFQIILTLFSTTYGIVFEQTIFNGVVPAYLGGKDTKLILGPRFGLFLTFFVLFNNVVPISLYVTIEMVNYGQAFLIDNDREMYHEKTDTPAVARSSSLIGDLGQVQWIFSDKTGTLTCNEMHLRQCFFPSNPSGGGLPFGEVDEVTGPFQDNRLKAILLSKNNKSMQFVKGRDFFTALALCHTVVAETKNDKEHDETMSGNNNNNNNNNDKYTSLCYRAESPDEAALVEGAAQMGFVFLGRAGKDSIKIQCPNMEQKSYALLAINEFNSTRKRMSVIVRDVRTKKIKLICKGADNVILSRCAKSTDVSDNGVYNKNLSEFAKVGLRTLVVAERTISESEFKNWYASYEKARKSIVDRGKKISKCC